MKCERCLKGGDTQYRVYTDLIDMKVCGSCAEEARELGIAVEVLNSGEGKKIGRGQANQKNIAVAQTDSI